MQMADQVPPVADEAGQARDQVVDYIERALSSLRRLAAELAVLADSAGAGALDDASMAPIIDVITASLTESEDLIGLGFTAERGVVNRSDNYLLWFQKSASAASRQLVLNLDSKDSDFYNYHDTVWFSGARVSGLPSIYGPYLDYAGADRAVYTVAVPVHVAGRFVGVAGGDLDVEVVERRVGRILAQMSRPSAVVTRDRVVIAESGTGWMPGERVPEAETQGGGRSRHALTDWSGWQLVMGLPTRP
jgi:hypothetical protein